MATAKANSEASDAQRHTVYPYYTLQKAIETAVIVKDLGGVNGDVQKSLIAQHLGVDEKSPTLLGVLGAARLYGLIDGRGAYRLSETAKRYFFPTTESDCQLAKLEMVKGPPLFRALIERFDGTRLPTPEMLVNILHRDHHIAESWRSRAASLFLSSLRDAGVIDAAGFLRFKASLHTANNGSVSGMSYATLPQSLVQSPTPFQPSPSVESAPPVEQLPRSGVAGWTYRGIRVDVPEDLTMELWKKLSDYVNVLKPEGS